MSYGYSIDLRKKVLSYIQDGHTQKEASVIFQIPRQTIYNWDCLEKQTGSVKMRRTGKRRASKFDEAKLKAFIVLYPDYYLSEIADNFKASTSGAGRALKRLGITRKKRVFSSRSEMKSGGRTFSYS